MGLFDLMCSDVGRVSVGLSSLCRRTGATVIPKMIPCMLFPAVLSDDCTDLTPLYEQVKYLSPHPEGAWGLQAASPTSLTILQE